MHYGCQFGRAQCEHEWRLLPPTPWPSVGYQDATCQSLCRSAQNWQDLLKTDTHTYKITWASSLHTEPATYTTQKYKLPTQIYINSIKAQNHLKDDRSVHDYYTEEGFVLLLPLGNYINNNIPLTSGNADLLLCAELLVKPQQKSNN